MSATPQGSGSALTRRSLFRLGGGLAVAGLGLSACSGGSESPDPFSSSAPPGSAGGGAKESPMLVEQVKSGKLPELAERLPASPKTVEVLKDPGQYGGTLRYAQTDSQSNAVLQAFAFEGLLEWTFAADGAEPSLAEKFEKSDDNTTYTITLREGLKWSDGKPFTSSDLDFAINGWLLNKTLVPALPFWFSNTDGTDPKAEFPDDLTLKITFQRPFALFEKYLCHPAVSYQMLKPRHYLESFHVDFADKANVSAAAKKAGFDTWDQYFADRDNAWLNADRPVLGAYTVVKAAGAQSGTAELERNPYYFKTDSEGRQLPYVDKMQVQTLDQDALDLRAANGDLDFQGNFLGYGTTQVYLQNAESRGFSVLRWTPTAGLLSLCPNLSHQDPVLRKIFEDVDVRAALSHAINREEMNDILLGGLGKIRQPIATEDSEYFVPDSGNTFISHDVDKANQLLDGAGLDKKNGDGIRLRPDGKPLSLVLMYVENDSAIPQTAAFQQVVKAWKAVGVKLSIRPVDGTLYAQLRLDNNFDIDGTTVPSDDWDLEPVWYIPTASNSHSAPGYGQWYSTKGDSGVKPSAEIQELLDTWDSLRTAASDEDRIAAGKKIMQQHNEKVYVIGLLDLPFQPVIITNKLKNVRDDAPKLSFYYGREGIAEPDQCFFAQ